MFGITEKSYYIIIEFLEQQKRENLKNFESIYIFGSRAVGNFKKGSDIDLVVMGENVTDEFVAKLNYQMNEVLSIPYYVDVLNYNTIENEDLIKEIDNKGKLFFE